MVTLSKELEYEQTNKEAIIIHASLCLAVLPAEYVNHVFALPPQFRKAYLHVNHTRHYTQTNKHLLMVQLHRNGHPLKITTNKQSETVRRVEI